MQAGKGKPSHVSPEMSVFYKWKTLYTSENKVCLRLKTEIVYKYLRDPLPPGPLPPSILILILGLLTWQKTRELFCGDSEAVEIWVPASPEQLLRSPCAPLSLPLCSWPHSCCCLGPNALLSAAGGCPPAQQGLVQVWGRSGSGSPPAGAGSGKYVWWVTLQNLLPTPHSGTSTKVQSLGGDGGGGERGAGGCVWQF